MVNVIQWAVKMGRRLTTDTPFGGRRWQWNGPVPPVPSHRMDELLKAATKLKPCVTAEPFDDPDDADVFAAVYAIQPVKGEPWLVRGVLRHNSPGPPLLRRVAVEHFLVDDGREVTGEVVRSLNLASIRNEALARLSALSTVATVTRKVGGVSAWSEQQIEAIDDATGHSIHHYRRIAIRYLERVAEGRRDVLKALAEEEGVKRETVRGWLRKATSLGLLTSGTQGRAGREAGPNLYRKEHNDG
jgi:hypothetical protein